MLLIRKKVAKHDLTEAQAQVEAAAYALIQGQENPVPASAATRCA
jgi:hypothetical protein